MTLPPAGVECELKLALTAADYERLRGALPGRTGEVKQHNLFWDSSEGRLAAERWALRLRRESDADRPARVIFTVKGPATRVGGSVRRTELEADADEEVWQRALAGELATEDIGGAPGAFLRQQLSLCGPLRRVLDFNNLRTRFAMDLAGAPRLLELDRTDFATGERDHELELELAPDGIGSSAELLLEVKAVWAALEGLLADHGVRATPSPGGKFSRALRYAGNR